MKMLKKNLFIVVSVFSFFLGVFSLNYFNVEIKNKSFFKSFDQLVRSCLFYSLKKDEFLFFDELIFEGKMKEQMDILTSNYELDFCALEVNYVYVKSYMKGVNIWLNYQIGNYPKLINIKYVMNQ